jgi:hypothetical protein
VRKAYFKSEITNPKSEINIKEVLERIGLAGSKGRNSG